jgi:hypothetical protein
MPTKSWLQSNHLSKKKNRKQKNEKMRVGGK